MSLRFALALLAATSLQTAAGLTLIFGRRLFRRDLREQPAESSSIGLGDLALGVVALGTATLGSVILLSPVGLRLFGAIHVLYMGVFVVTPMLGLCVLSSHFVSARRQRWPRASGSARAFCAASLALPVLCVYVSWIEPKSVRLERQHVALAGEREGRDPVRIGVLADIQNRSVGDFERSAIRRLMNEEPDIILIPGDLYQGSRQDLPARAPAFRELLSELRAPGGVFFVAGNAEIPGTVESLLRGTGVRFLDDEWIETSVGDRRITIGGNSVWVSEPGARKLARELEALPERGDVRILLTHFPGALYNLSPNSRVDLVVAGHTHGGQVRLPFFGPPIHLSKLPRRAAAGGLHSLEGRSIYVSRGLGMERGQAPPIRFLCPPEITLLTLE